MYRIIYDGFIFEILAEYYQIIRRVTLKRSDILKASYSAFYLMFVFSRILDLYTLFCRYIYS